MSFLTGFLVHLPAVMAGGLLVHRLLPGNRPAQLLYKFGIGIGLGLGLTSLLYFVLLLAINSLAGYIFIPVVLLIIGIFLTWHNRVENPILPQKIELSRLHWYFIVAFGVVILISLGSYAIHALMNPHGGFDAWMIYNRTARFFYRADTSDWRNAFSPTIYWQFHADYPLLLPLNMAGAWQTLGSENMRAAQAHGTYILLGLLLMLMGVVAWIRTPGQALLAGIVLLGTPVYVYEGPREAADLTLAFFVLGTTASLFLYHSEHNPKFLWLAGFSSVLAAWTKNEGILFLVIGAASCLLLLYRDRKVKDFSHYLFGLAPLLLVLYFKYFLAPSNDLFSSRADLIARVTDLNRYVTILQEFIGYLVWFGRGNISLLAVLLVYLLIVRIRPDVENHDAFIACGLLLGIQLAGYLAIYVLTPHDLDWHLRTSLARLLMHLYPAAVFLLLAALNDPEAVFAKPAESSL